MLLIDAVVLCKDLVVTVAMSIDTEGRKRLLGFRIGSSESTEVCMDLLSDLAHRKLKPAQNRELLVILDGSKALRNAVIQHYPNALIQRCLVHKERNIRRYLARRHWNELANLFGRLRRSQGEKDALQAAAELEAFLAAKNTQAKHSLEEAGEELLTVFRLEIPNSLHGSLLSTNADKLRFDKPVGYTTRFSVVGLSDSVSANRIDAQCFSPEAVFYEDWLLKHANCGRLSLLLSSTAKGRQQVETETGTTDYCSIKHITSREIVGASKAYPAAGTPTARKDDLLLAITGATIGKIGIVNRYDNLVFSGDMLRLRANGSIYPHYLLLTLDHHLGQVQFNRWITGSTNGHLAPRDVGRVLVPRLAPEKEEQIAALVAESLEKRQESEQLLDQAKSRVEQLIEEAMRA